MVVELRGVEFVNKGAELMLHGMVQMMRDRFPGVDFVMERRGRAPMNKQRAMGIDTKLKSGRWERQVRLLSALLPASVFNSFHLVKEEQINLVLDASGFAFGDKWGARKAGSRLADHIRQWRAEGKKIILLPQAFGPFSDAALKDKMAVILEHANLIYARDPVSYQHLKELDPDNKRIRMKPDFTNLVQGVVPPYFDSSKHQVAMIPNTKMIEKTGPAVRVAYPSFMKNAVEEVQRQHLSPFFLIHEAGKDEQLAEELNEQLASPIPIVAEENPLWVKGIIGSSRAAITSRFHGLASALSQAVPCLTTGWSHKYEMLLQEYEYPEGLCEVANTDKAMEKIQYILKNSDNKKIREHLSKKASVNKQKSTAMWEEVFKEIKGLES